MAGTTRKQGYVGALRAGEKDFALRNPITDARMLVSALKSTISFAEMMGWDAAKDTEKLKDARRQLRKVLASKVTDMDFDSRGELR